MSELLLERLSKKTTKQKMKPIEIKLDKGQVEVQLDIVESNEEYDMELFKENLLKRGLQAPKLPINKIEVIDVGSFSSLHTITGFNSPRSFLPVSSTKAYVTDLYSNSIQIVNLNSSTITGSILVNGWTEDLIQYDGNF